MLVLCAPAMAQTTHMNMPEDSKQVQVALVAVNAPRSEGSAQRQSLIAPIFSVQWSNGYFIRMNEFGVRLSDQPGLDYGLVAVPTFSRATNLPGSGEASKRKFTPELGGFFNYQVAHGLNLTAGLLYGGSVDHRGLRLRLGAQFWTPVAEHHSVGVTGGLVLANRSALQANFAVSPEQAPESLAAHEVSGGLHRTSLGARWLWDLNQKYTLSSGLEWRRLHGSAASSPRVEQANGVAFSTLLSYGF